MKANLTLIITLGAFCARSDGAIQACLMSGLGGIILLAGGMVGNRMGLWRFDFGLGGGQVPIIDILSGLGPLQNKGSFKITYDPSSNEWKLYGVVSNEFVDPESVSNLLGAGVDTTYTGLRTPFMGLAGRTTGLDIYDNVTVSRVPAPSLPTVV